MNFYFETSVHYHSFRTERWTRQQLEQCSLIFKFRISRRRPIFSVITLKFLVRKRRKPLVPPPLYRYCCAPPLTLSVPLHEIREEGGLLPPPLITLYNYFLTCIFVPCCSVGSSSSWGDRDAAHSDFVDAATPLPLYLLVSWIYYYIHGSTPAPPPAKRWI